VSISVVKCSWVKCGEVQGSVCSVVMVLVITCLTVLEDINNRKLLLVCILLLDSFIFIRFYVLSISGCIPV
jgi:hypothetical protein